MLSATSFECPESLLRQARQHPPIPVAVVRANSRLTLESARLASDHEIAAPELVGDPAVIHDLCAEIGWDIRGVPVHAATSEEQAAFIAVGLARQRRIAALMKGDLHTDTLMRAILSRDQGLGTGRHMSHVFRMTLPDSDAALCITDAVVNVLPTVEHKVAIARNAIELLQALGQDRINVAILSATEVQTPSMPSSVEAAEVCRSLAGQLPAGVEVAGPMALDIAVSADAAKRKGVTGPVAGRADVLLVPNIETGNALFKIMVHFMGATAAGIVLGARVPVMLTSRGDPVEARLASAALAAIYSRAGPR